MGQVVNAQRNAQPGVMPSIEVSRKLIEHFNRGQMAGIDAVGYFVFQNVRVIEEGKRAESDARDALTQEEKAFGKK